MKRKTIYTLPAVALLTLMTAAPGAAIKNEEVKTPKPTDQELTRPTTEAEMDTGTTNLEVAVEEVQDMDRDEATVTTEDRDVTYDAEVETEAETGYLNDSDDVGTTAREGDEVEPLTDEYGEDLDATMRYEENEYRSDELESDLDDDRSNLAADGSEWQYGSDEQPSELPRTASPLALMALLGAGGIGGAAGLRRIRRS